MSDEGGTDASSTPDAVEAEFTTWVDVQVERFRQVRDLYSDYASRLADAVMNELTQAGIQVVAVTSRAKSDLSFREKVERRPGRYKDPIDEITDLAGVRVVLYYRDDVDEAIQVLEGRFEIDAENSVDKRQLLAPDQFGYSASHLVLSPDASRRDLAEWAAFSNLKAEVQVRTVLQDAWSILDHRLKYKATEDAPPELQRELSKLNALIELADDVFADLRRLSGEIEKSYRTSFLQGKLNRVALDRDAMDAFVRSRVAADLVSTARALGWTIYQDDDLPAWRDSRERDRLLDLARMVRVQTVDELVSLLPEAELRDRMLGAFRVNLEKEGVRPYTSTATLLSILIAASSRVDLDFGSLYDNYGSQIASAVEGVREDLAL